MNDHYYLEVIPLVERLHRHFLEVVKLELERMGIRDINSGQAMMLFNIGDAEMTIGELTLRGTVKLRRNSGDWLQRSSASCCGGRGAPLRGRF